MEVLTISRPRNPESPGVVHDPLSNRHSESPWTMGMSAASPQGQLPQVVVLWKGPPSCVSAGRRPPSWCPRGDLNPHALSGTSTSS